MIGVIFDCDGTLLDSMGAWRGMEQELAHRAGVELSEADHQALLTMSTPGAATFFHERFSLGSSAAAVQDIIVDYMFSYYSTQATPRPGALEFVRALYERGVRLAVASSTPAPSLRAGLDFTGFTPFLTAIVSVDDVGKSKREPAVYDRARALMGTDLAATWGVEDTLYAVRTLKAAQYRTIGIYECDSSATFHDLSTLCDIAIHSFEELNADTFIEHAQRLMA